MSYTPFQNMSKSNSRAKLHSDVPSLSRSLDENIKDKVNPELTYEENNAGTGYDPITSNDHEPESKKANVVRLRGLPWQVSEKMIRNFFTFGRITANDIKNVLMTRNYLGRPNGGAYVEFTTSEKAALALKNNLKAIGRRYVEVFPMDFEQYETLRKAAEKEETNLTKMLQNIKKMDTDSGIYRGNSEHQGYQFVARMRGLPYDTTNSDIIKRFSKSEIHIKECQIHHILRICGTPTGECFVEVNNENDFEKVLSIHRKMIKNRYCEVFASSKIELVRYLLKQRQEFFDVLSRVQYHFSEFDTICVGSMYPDHTKCCIRLRGLPYGSDIYDVEQFLAAEMAELNITPNGIVVLGNYNGDGYCELQSEEDAEKLMNKKNREYIGDRYIAIKVISRRQMCFAILLTLKPEDGKRVPVEASFKSFSQHHPYNNYQEQVTYDPGLDSQLCFPQFIQEACVFNETFGAPRFKKQKDFIPSSFNETFGAPRFKKQKDFIPSSGCYVSEYKQAEEYQNYQVYDTTPVESYGEYHTTPVESYVQH